MNQSVVKALKLLTYFDEKNKEWSLKDLAEVSKLPKPTAYRLLKSLESAGFLTYGQNEKYRLGLRLLELGNLVAEQLDIRKIAKPYMEALGEEINEAVHLVVRNEDQATYIEKVDSNRAIRLYTNVGKSSPLYVGSGPKLLLSFMDPDLRDEILNAEPLHSMHSVQPINKKELLDELATIRSQGYSISYGEQDEGTVGISYPIYDNQGDVAGALTVSGLMQHFEGPSMDVIKAKTAETAEKISSSLGAPVGMVR